MSFDRSSGQSKSAERRREALREIREELERLRRAEAKVGEGLGSMRAARHRVEELVRGIGVEDDAVRSIVREELAAGGGVRPLEVEGPRASEARVGDNDVGRVERVPAVATPGVRAGASAMPWSPERTELERTGGIAPAVITPARTKLREHRFFNAGVAGVSALVIGGVAWLTVQALKSTQPSPTLTIGGDSTAPAVAVAPAPPPEDTVKSQTERFFIQLPDDPTQRAAVYDSLWLAHSPMLAAMVDEVETSTEERDVKRAVTAWKAGQLTPLEQDLLHSALVQLALRDQAGAKVDVDGQLLRNPCRGASCDALLSFWKTRGSEVGLSEPPADASKNTRAMHLAESVLVLKVLEDRALGRATTGQ